MYLKFEEDTLGNKEVIKIPTFFHENPQVKGGNSNHYGTRVVNLNPYYVLMIRNLYFNFENTVKLYWSSAKIVDLFHCQDWLVSAYVKYRKMHVYNGSTHV
jgi:hypothetical protein